MNKRVFLAGMFLAVFAVILGIATTAHADESIAIYTGSVGTLEDSSG